MLPPACKAGHLPEWKNHASVRKPMRPSVVVIVVVTLLAAAGIFALLQWRNQPELGTPTMTTSDPLQSAITLAESKGCRACHSLDGTAGIGPSWAGSYGGNRTFADGSQLPADDAYLRESILQPAARVVAGYQNVMVAAALSEDEVATLLTLIRQLSPGTLK
jgi:cytochrome c oxidase subunit II